MIPKLTTKLTEERSVFVTSTFLQYLYISNWKDAFLVTITTFIPVSINLANDGDSVTLEEAECTYKLIVMSMPSLHYMESNNSVVCMKS